MAKILQFPSALMDSASVPESVSSRQRTGTSDTVDFVRSRSSGIVNGCGEEVDLNNLKSYTGRPLDYEGLQERIQMLAEQSSLLFQMRLDAARNNVTEKCRAELRQAQYYLDLWKILGPGR